MSSSPSTENKTHMDYEPTLMYGKYSAELGEFAKQQADRIKEEKRRAKEEATPLRTYDTSLWSQCKQKVAGMKIVFFQYVGAEWVFLLVLGITMALLSFAMDYTIQKCQKAHYWLYTELQDYIALQYFAWVLFPLVFIAFSVGFVHIVSPQAVGSGIPEMKTIMRGVVLHEYLTFRVLVAKMIGLTSSLGSRLPIGKEGPFVHIASICATLLNKFLINFSSPYENESRHIEMLAAACAVGVACNFAAPIGGVLFSIEVTSVYFAVRNYWRGFFSAVCGALAFRLLAVWNSEEETITALFKTNFRVEFPFDLQELLAFSMIGIVSGFAGAFFVYIHRKIVKLNRSHKRVKKFLQRNRYIYPLLVSLVIGSMTYPRGLGQFMAGELTLKEALDTLFDNKTWSKLGYIDESEVLPDVQQGWQHPTVNVYVTLVVFIVTHFFMTAVAITLAVPSGVFMPVFLIGAAFGRLVGECVAALYPDGFYSGEQVFRIVPGGYAVVGAASLAGAVTHTISTSVIVFELTGQIAHILPVMIAVLISNAIAQSLQPSIYDSIIQIKSLPYLPDIISGKRKLYSVYVQDFMVKKVSFLSCVSTYGELYKLLKESKLKIFPLVDTPQSMTLIGSVQRSALQSLLDEHLSEASVLNGVSSAAGKNSQSPNRPDIARERSHSAGADLKDIVVNVRLSPTSQSSSIEDIYAKQVKLDDCLIDPSPFQLVERTSLHKVHSLFSLLGLSHAYVTSIGRLVGVVSLKELRRAIQGAANGDERSAEKDPEHVRIFYDHTTELVALRELDESSDD